MVLYKRKPIILPAAKELPRNLGVNVWHLNETGEWFTSYEEYLDRLDFYKTRHFTCEITGTSSLTFFDALNSEELQFRLVEEKFPLKLREPIARFLHFNEIRRLDVLVERVYSKFKNDFYPGETVFLRKKGPKQISPTPPNDLDGTGPVVSQIQVPRSYIIREKAQFNTAAVPEIPGSTPQPFSKYMLVDEHGLRSVIADQTQIYRDRSTFTKHLIKCFCKITLRRASSKMGAPWCVKNEYLPVYGLVMDWPAEMAHLKDDDKNSVIESNSEIGGEGIERKRTAEDGNNLEQNSGLKKSKTGNGGTKEVEEPLHRSKESESRIPYVPLIQRAYKNTYCYDQRLEKVPQTSIACKFPAMTKLVEIHQFLMAFKEVLMISKFSLEEFVMSLKCTTIPQQSPSRIKASIRGANPKVEDEFKNFDLATFKDALQAPFGATSYFTKLNDLVNCQPSQHICYEVEQAELESLVVFDDVAASGCSLLVECFVALLRLFIDEGGDWRCLVAERWLEEEATEKVDEEMSTNHLNTDTGAVKDQELKNDTSDNLLEPHINDLLEKSINYRNISWSERLIKRNFQNGSWLIILLGVYQDCMHMPLYTDLIEKFISKVVPSGGHETQLGKSLWRNFCQNLSLEEKVESLWILVDLTSNFSQDIKEAVDASMELCSQLRSERFKISRDLKVEISKLQNTSTQVKEANESTINSEEAQKLGESLIELEGNVKQLGRDKVLLDQALVDNDLQKLRPVGKDRHGNKYFWFKGKGDRNLNSLEKTQFSQLWIQGPYISEASYFLEVSVQDIDKWLETTSKSSSIAATKSIFQIYRVDDGSYNVVNGNLEQTLLDAGGKITTSVELSPIQKKILDEMPERLQISSTQWSAIDTEEDFLCLLTRLSSQIKCEQELSKGLRNDQSSLIEDLKQNETILAGIDKRINALVDEFSKYTLSDDDFVESLEPLDYKKTLQNERELDDILQELMELDDSSKTRKALNRIEELETRRDELIKSRSLAAKDSSQQHGLTLKGSLNNLQVRDHKLKCQTEILTELSNLKRTICLETATSWDNLAARKVWNTTLYKGAAGESKVEIDRSSESRLSKILENTFRVINKKP
ncbi:LAMI_0G09934g1_1 [Lachancea mirantina]|uniref:LAMI_0G09934g1_1 n=1 Tax=Lachancea mirantina TaxID=1230905 RepID=A0A1G4KAM2_9SACH|nr:LAMI_0G09934g1_1 [Lachancea mirantina]